MDSPCWDSCPYKEVKGPGLSLFHLVRVQREEVTCELGKGSQQTLNLLAPLSGTSRPLQSVAFCYGSLSRLSHNHSED